MGNKTKYGLLLSDVFLQMKENDERIGYSLDVFLNTFYHFGFNYCTQYWWKNWDITKQVNIEEIRNIFLATMLKYNDEPTSQYYNFFSCHERQLLLNYLNKESSKAYLPLKREIYFFIKKHLPQYSSKLLFSDELENRIKNAFFIRGCHFDEFIYSIGRDLNVSLEFEQYLWSLSFAERVKKVLGWTTSESIYVMIEGKRIFD